MLLLMSTLSFADGIDDIFADGTDEFEFERFSDDSILLAIDSDAQLACGKDGLCTLTSVTNNSSDFEVSFNIGQGTNYGNYGQGSGTVINLGDNGNSNNNGDFWGINVKYSRGKCTQKVNVPRALFYSMNRYLYGLMNEDGSTRRGFTPADEAMILFYTTILNKASGCSK